MNKLIPLILLLSACVNHEYEPIPDPEYTASWGEEAVTDKDTTRYVTPGRISKNGVACFTGKTWRMYQHNINYSSPCYQSSLTYRIEPKVQTYEDPNFLKGTDAGTATIRVQNTGDSQIKVRNGNNSWVYLNAFQTYDFVVNIPLVPCNTSLAAMTVYFTIEAKNVGCVQNAQRWKYNAWIYSMTTVNTGNGTHSIDPLSSSWFYNITYSIGNCPTCVTY